MNDAELTLLSLLAENDRYDYEFSALIEERGLRAWINIGLSSILYLLGRLENQGLITSETRHDPHGNARRRYRLTSAGHGVLQTAVGERLRQPRALGTPFEIGLANLHILKPGRVYQLLTHHHNDLVNRLAHIEGVIANRPPDSTDSITALYTHSRDQMRAEIEWLARFLADWQARYPAVDDTNSDPAERTRVSPVVNDDDPNRQMQVIRRPPDPDQDDDIAAEE